MPKFLINGGKKLSGEIEVNGAKNSVLKIIPASILSKEKITIKNCPLIEDVNKELLILEDLGAIVEVNGKTVEIDTKNINKTELNKLAVKFRASMLLVGPMLGRFGDVKFPHPGGCAIEATGRPINFFLEGFKAFGAKIEIKENHYHIKAEELKGCEYFFPWVSVTATESHMMTAVLAKGTTVLRNCAMEPEIKALADYLNKQGAKIKGAGTPKMTIEGVNSIKAGTFEVIPDRIETGSFAIMAVAAKSKIKITNCNPEHIRILLEIFKKIGVKFDEGKNWLQIHPVNKILPYNIKTHEYPGFATDMQPPYTLLMTQAEGKSMIHETIYDRRLLWTDKLVMMGANITMCDPHRVVVYGSTKLYGRSLTAPDLRAGIAMVIAGLIAEGQTEIDNIYQIERGYENIVSRLQKIGADIKKIED